MREKTHTAALEKISHVMDFSNFNKNHPLYSTRNQKKLFFFKSETADKKIILFTGIRPKVYGVVTQEELQRSVELKNKLDTGILKLKGVNRSVVPFLGIEAYLSCILFDHHFMVCSRKISSKSHTLFKTDVTKSALLSVDLKNQEKSCRIHVVPYGSGSGLVCNCI